MYKQCATKCSRRLNYFNCTKVANNFVLRNTAISIMQKVFHSYSSQNIMRE